MSKELIKEVHFTIEGEFLANFARTRVKEGAYQHALEVLSCLEGLPLEDQVKILKGEKTLQGSNNSVYLADAHPDIKKDMDNWYHSKYSSILKYKNKLYQPYAYVQSWHRQDLPKERSFFSVMSKQFIYDFEPDLMTHMYDNNLDSFFQGHPHSRSLYYADDPKKDFAINIHAHELNSKPWTDKATVLFKEVTEQLPFWIQNYYVKTPLESVNNFTIYNTLELYGANHLDIDTNNETNDYNETSHNESNIADSSLDNIYSLENTQRRLDFVKQYTKNTLSDDEYWKLYDDDVKKYTEQVIDFANNDKEYGWKTFTDPQNEEHSIRVPYRAFLCYALAKALMRTHVYDVVLPPYQSFFPSGMKMGGDNPHHTDAWCGAGFSIEDAYEDHLWQNRLFENAVSQCQSLYFKSSDFTILNSAQQTSFSGTIVHIHNFETVPVGKRILVLPHLGVEFDTVAKQCDAIITETGGKLAHLVTIGREFGIPIIRIPDAMLNFAAPVELNFDLVNIKMTPTTTTSAFKKI